MFAIAKLSTGIKTRSALRDNTLKYFFHKMVIARNAAAKQFTSFEISQIRTNFEHFLDCFATLAETCFCLLLHEFHHSPNILRHCEEIGDEEIHKP